MFVTSQNGKTTFPLPNSPGYPLYLRIVYQPLYPRIVNPLQYLQIVNFTTIPKNNKPPPLTSHYPAINSILYLSKVRDKLHFLYNVTSPKLEYARKIKIV